MFDYVVKQVFFFVSLSAGCGLDFHKRCAFKLPNDCSRVYRRCGPSLSLFPPGRPRSSTLSSNTGGSLEEVTVLAKDYRIPKMCRSYRFKWGKNATVNMAALSNEAPPSEQTSQCLISKVSASLQLPLEVPVYIYIYAFSRRFYPKQLTIAFRLDIVFFSTCVPWESNPQPFVLLTQCPTTEPHRNTGTQFVIETIASQSSGNLPVSLVKPSRK